MRFIGFNLHAEKGKPGQYIGKVDADSPAEHAGLRQGDRILEVNGTDIGAETHKQVVERIKAIPNETTLLVLAPSSSSNLKASSPTLNGNTTTTTTNGNGNSMEHHMNENNNGNGDVIMGENDKMNENTKNIINNNEKMMMMNGSNNEEHQTHDNNHEKMSTGVGGGALQMNLKMTAAEMRAMLQARKKRDPKNESIDLKKKYDIIEKL